MPIIKSIQQLEEHQRRSRGAYPVAHGFIEAYSNRERKITGLAKVILALPLITVFSIAAFRRINKQQKQLLVAVKNTPIASEEEYNQLLVIYKATEKFVKALSSISTVSVEQYDSTYKSAPFIFKPFLKPIFEYMKLSVTLYQALGEKLCLLPKNVTDKQLEEAAILNEGLEDLFEDEDEEDYIDYAKTLSLRQSGHSS